MFPAHLIWCRRQRQGLSLIEALVTILLTSLAFGLIFSLGRAQSKVQRFQESHERFIVDADAFLRVVAEDLGSAFAFDGSSGSTIMRIGHLEGYSSGGGLPANEPMNVASNHTGPNTNPPTSRGRSIRTIYTLQNERIVRQHAESTFSYGTVPGSQLTVLDGVNAATATRSSTDPANILILLTLKSETKVMTLERSVFAPGLVP